MSENRIVDVYKANIPLIEGESVQLFLDRMRTQLRKKFGKVSTKNNPGIYVWPRAVFSERLIMDREPDNPSDPRQMESVTYTRKDNGDFEFGAPVKVLEQVNFVPVAKAQEQPERIEFESVWKGLV